MKPSDKKSSEKIEWISCYDCGIDIPFDSDEPCYNCGSKNRIIRTVNK